mmetsp:Transcript_3131/g.8090  ORF Transcript_3131/g.8090 Transcript_3131/m.8090 type:complete len:142 (+) Transcript_3131:142-567(+)
MSTSPHTGTVTQARVRIYIYEPTVVRQAPRASSCCIVACGLAAVSCSCAAVLSNWLLYKVWLGAPQATPATESNQPESTNLNNVKAAGPSASPICLGIGSASASADHLCHQLCHQLCHCYTRHGEREREREREDDGERSPP